MGPAELTDEQLRSAGRAFCRLSTSSRERLIATMAGLHMGLEGQRRMFIHAVTAGGGITGMLITKDETDCEKLRRI